MALPQGWRRDFSTNDDVSGKRKIYEVVYTLPNAANGAVTGGKYAVVFNAKTGARDIYTQDAIFGTRTLLLTINSDGTRTKGPVYNEIAGKQNGNTRISDAVNASQVNINRLINSSDTVNGLTAEEKAKLKKEKAFGGPGDEPAPTKPGGDGPESDSSGPNSKSGATTSFGSLRTVQNFNKGDTGYQNFKYPTTIESGQDYMIINIFNYKVADIFGSGGVANISPEAFLAGQSLSSRQFNELKESLAHIRLPVPNNIMEANQTKWGSSELNNLAAGLLAGATGTVGGVATGDFMTAGEYTDATVKKILEGNTPGKTLIKQKLTLGAASKLINKLGVKVDAEAFRARATGTVVNPNLELLFNGPSLRQFQFQYKLTPRSLEEAKQIRGIIKTFKKAMAPKRGTAVEDAFFLGAPNVFQLKFMRGTGENKYLPSIKTCALTNFSANYTADGFYSAYYDGQPISIDIVLQFAELTPIYNDHYTIDTESVGFNKDLNSLEKSTTAPVTSEPAAEAEQPAATEAQRVELQRQLNNPSGLAGGAGRPLDTAADVIERAGGAGRPGTEPVFTGGVRGI